MSPITLIFLLGTAQLGWQISPPAFKSGVTDVGDYFAERVAISAAEAEQSVEEYIVMSLLATSAPPIPKFEYTKYALNHIQGLTDAQIVEKFGAPHWDSRDEGDENTSYFLVYAEPGGFFGWRALIEFQDNVVTDSRHVSK